MDNQIPETDLSGQSPSPFKHIWELIRSASYTRTLSVLALLVIAAAVPLTVFVSQQKQETRQHASESPTITDTPTATPNTFVPNTAGRITICAQGNDNNTDYIIAKLYKLGVENAVATIGSTWDNNHNRCDEEPWPGNIGEGNYAIKFTPVKGTVSGETKTVEPVSVRAAGTTATPVPTSPAATNTPTAGSPAITDTISADPHTFTANTAGRITICASGNSNTDYVIAKLYKLGVEAAQATIGSTWDENPHNRCDEEPWPGNIGEGNYAIKFTPIKRTGGGHEVAGETKTFEPVLVQAGGTPPVTTNTPAAGSTTIDLNLGLIGVSNTGGNASPQRRDRNVTVELLDGTDTVKYTKTGTVTFDASSKNFKGRVNLGSVTAGSYTVKVKSDMYLKKRLPGIYTVASGGSGLVPSAISLTPGDVNGDNKTYIDDYNILAINCFGQKANTPSCGNYKQLADLNDDGTIDGVDYNVFLSYFTVRQGD